MDKLVSTGFVTSTPKIFARNSMEIAVKPGNPQHVTSVSSLATAGTISICATTAPCGIYGASVLARAKVTIPPTSITRAPDATSTIAQVTNGDAVAALVYVSDVDAAGSTVQGVAIPANQNVVAFYPIAPLAGTSNPKLAKAFSAYVASPAGEKVLAKHGFHARRHPKSRRGIKGAPWPILALALIALAFFVLPLVGLLRQAPWGSLWGDLTTPAALDALRLSLECSLCSTVLCVILGVPLAWVLARSNFPGRSLMRALVLLPMVLPPVVGGVALLYAFGRSNGLIGPWLYSAFGIQLTFSPAGVVLAETFVAMPFLVITVEGAFRAIDGRFEDAAATLGAGRFTTFRRITLRFLAPSLAAGTALAWARSRRVRCDHHVCRERSRAESDNAIGGVPVVGIRSRRRGRS